MDVCRECCVLSGRGLCDELITRPEESYRLWCVVECDLETSWMRRSTGGCRAKRRRRRRRRSFIDILHHHNAYNLTHILIQFLFYSLWRKIWLLVISIDKSPWRKWEEYEQVVLQSTFNFNDHISNKHPVRDIRFWQRCCWRFKSCDMLRRTDC